MLNTTSPKTDEKIRAALRDADRKGKLQVVAAVTGIAGGAASLRKIMKSTDELSMMDRSMLGLHLNCTPEVDAVRCGVRNGVTNNGDER